MIFQLAIDLEIEDKKVQAIIDLDNGVVGFTELVENETTEYYYHESPISFRKALVEKLEPFFAKKRFTNFKISGKDENMRNAMKYLRDAKKE